MTDPALLDRVRKALESVPLIRKERESGWTMHVWHEPDYHALAAKVAGWLEHPETAP